jgi:hypothetical protein
VFEVETGLTIKEAFEVESYHDREICSESWPPVPARNLFDDTGGSNWLQPGGARKLSQVSRACFICKLGSAWECELACGEADGSGSGHEAEEEKTKEIADSIVQPY